MRYIFKKLSQDIFIVIFFVVFLSFFLHVFIYLFINSSLTMMASSVVLTLLHKIAL